MFSFYPTSEESTECSKKHVLVMSSNVLDSPTSLKFVLSSNCKDDYLSSFTEKHCICHNFKESLPQYVSCNTINNEYLDIKSRHEGRRLVSDNLFPFNAIHNYSSVLMSYSESSSNPSLTCRTDSPLDLSVKTSRKTPDSTADDCILLKKLKVPFSKEERDCLINGKLKKSLSSSAINFAQKNFFCSPSVSANEFYHSNCRKYFPKHSDLNFVPYGDITKHKDSSSSIKKIHFDNNNYMISVSSDSLLRSALSNCYYKDKDSNVHANNSSIENSACSPTVRSILRNSLEQKTGKNHRDICFQSENTSVLSRESDNISMNMLSLKCQCSSQAPCNCFAHFRHLSSFHSIQNLNPSFQEHCKKLKTPPILTSQLLPYPGLVTPLPQYSSVPNVTNSNIFLNIRDKNVFSAQQNSSPKLERVCKENLNRIRTKAELKQLTSDIISESKYQKSKTVIGYNLSYSPSSLSKADSAHNFNPSVKISEISKSNIKNKINIWTRPVQSLNDQYGINNTDYSKFHALSSGDAIKKKDYKQLINNSYEMTGSNNDPSVFDFKENDNDNVTAPDIKTILAEKIQKKCANNTQINSVVLCEDTNFLTKCDQFLKELQNSNTMLGVPFSSNSPSFSIISSQSNLSCCTVSPRQQSSVSNSSNKIKCFRRRKIMHKLRSKLKSDSNSFNKPQDKFKVCSGNVPKSHDQDLWNYCKNQKKKMNYSGYQISNKDIVNNLNKLDVSNDKSFHKKPCLDTDRYVNTKTFAKNNATNSKKNSCINYENENFEPVKILRNRLITANTDRLKGRTSRKKFVSTGRTKLKNKKLCSDSCIKKRLRSRGFSVNKQKVSNNLKESSLLMSHFQEKNSRSIINSKQQKLIMQKMEFMKMQGCFISNEECKSMILKNNSLSNLKETYVSKKKELPLKQHRTKRKLKEDHYKHEIISDIIPLLSCNHKLITPANNKQLQFTDSDIESFSLLNLSNEKSKSQELSDELSKYSFEFMCHTLESTEKVTDSENTTNSLLQKNCNEINKLPKIALFKSLEIDKEVVLNNANFSFNDNIDKTFLLNSNVSYLRTSYIDDKVKTVPPVKKNRLRVFRRKFRSGFDYLKKKKKKKETSKKMEQLSKNKAVDCTEHINSQIHIENLYHVRAEIKSWVVNKGLGETVLHKAARLNYFSAAIYCLLNNPSSVHARDNAGYTPLHEACSKGHLEMARLLLQFDADCNQHAIGGIRPLNEAVDTDNVEMVRLLLSYGADPSLTTYSDYLPMKNIKSERMKIFFQDYLLDLKGTFGSPWLFLGTASCFDLENQGFYVFDHVPEYEENEDTYKSKRICFECSHKTLFHTFTIRRKPDKYALLNDVLSVTAIDFDTNEILTFDRPQFLEEVDCCQIDGKNRNLNYPVALIKLTPQLENLCEVEVLIL